MSTTAATTTASFAARRLDTDTGEPFATTRTLLSGTASAQDRKAHVIVALAEAGLLVPGFTPTGEAPKVTPQQYEVLSAFAEGLSYTETARTTFRSVETVKRHAGNLYRAWGVHSKVELVVEAVRAGVLPSPAPAAAPRARAAQVRCSTEGCRKRTSHASGACPDHRAPADD